MHFYDKYCTLCREKNVSPSRAAIEMGMDKSTVSVWKGKSMRGEDSTPSTDTVNKMVSYFGITADFILNCEKEKPVTENGDEPDELDIEIMKVFASLTPANKKAALAVLLSLAESQE